MWYLVLVWCGGMCVVPGVSVLWGMCMVPGVSVVWEDVYGTWC